MTHVIAESIPEAKSEIKQADIVRLTEHQQVLYEIIDDADEIQPGELFDTYESRIDDSKTKRTVRNHLSKSEHYNLIEAEGQTRGRIYRAAN